MRRRLVLPIAVCVGLVLVSSAGAAAPATKVGATLLQPSSGRYQVAVQNIGRSQISAFTIALGSGLSGTKLLGTRVTATPSGAGGTCALAGAAITCKIALRPPPCGCQPGDSVTVVFTASGSAAGSKVTIGAASWPITGATAGGGAATRTTAITVTGTDRALKLTKSSAHEGSVTFTVRNTGTKSHVFTIANRKSPTVEPGKTVELTVSFTRAGKYPYGWVGARPAGSVTVASS